MKHYNVKNQIHTKTFKIFTPSSHSNLTSDQRKVHDFFIMLVDAVRSEGRGTGLPMINDSRISEAKLFATANSTVQSRNFGEALYRHGSHLYRDAEHDRLRSIIPKERINHTQWHSDVVGTSSSQIVLHETARRNHVLLHSGSGTSPRANFSTARSRW
ncbi:hypothetical protein BD769DRAFT_1052497 [Suillus cothurnatus]|nr:hypothetical protein BD769DRAFT_1052497 [Suillus cothurnatus]